MKKAFPPWKYWTKSSLMNTLTQVMSDIGEDVKENIRTIVSSHNCVKEILELDFQIETNVAECMLTIGFSHSDLTLSPPSSKQKEAIQKFQFEILKDVSDFLVTTPLKPDVRIKTLAQGDEHTILTDWEHVVEIADGKIGYDDWSSIV